jgi:hypothetical protein
MDGSLFLIGVAKLLFGLLAAALGIYVAFRALVRLLGTNGAGGQPGATAIGTLEAASVVALGILGRNTLGATYDAIDLLLARHALSGPVLAKVALYALIHLAFTLLVGAAILGLGLWLFNRVTPDIDEMAEVRKGNLGAALMLSAILVVLALLTAPGLQAALNGLVPFPDLPDQVIIPPS